MKLMVIVDVHREHERNREYSPRFLTRQCFVVDNYSEIEHWLLAANPNLYDLKLADAPAQTPNLDFPVQVGRFYDPFPAVGDDDSQEDYYCIVYVQELQVGRFYPTR
jgi:hypothetical protein